ncbi:MAG: hypothetical protein IJ122_08360 [Methanobrevibacter sp.]|nr:hypothetical protein [Methanobrevibacter sp.]
MNQIEVDYDKKFLKEKRKLQSKCTSLEKDFERFEKALKIKIKENDYKVPVDNKKIFKIAGLDKRVTFPAFVVKSFYCENMNKCSNSGFRVTFVYDPVEKFIYFTQFYFKQKHEIEDKDRINRLFK